MILKHVLSFVIVFSPLYLLFNRLIHRQTLRGALVRGQAPFQRWLTYLTLFVIVVTVLVDAATLVFMLLEGEMTIRVFMKCIILFVAVGGVFVYLWMETKKWSTKLKSAEVPGPLKSRSRHCRNSLRRCSALGHHHRWHARHGSQQGTRPSEDSRSFGSTLGQSNASIVKRAVCQIASRSWISIRRPSSIQSQRSRTNML